jgi:hypothetical protein
MSFIRLSFPAHFYLYTYSFIFTYFLSCFSLAYFFLSYSLLRFFILVFFFLTLCIFTFLSLSSFYTNMWFLHLYGTVLVCFDWFRQLQLLSQQSYVPLSFPSITAWR